MIVSVPLSASVSHPDHILRPIRSSKYLFSNANLGREVFCKLRRSWWPLAHFEICKAVWHNLWSGCALSVFLMFTCGCFPISEILSWEVVIDLISPPFLFFSPANYTCIYIPVLHVIKRSLKKALNMSLACLTFFEYLFF